MKSKTAALIFGFCFIAAGPALGLQMPEADVGEGASNPDSVREALKESDSTLKALRAQAAAVFKERSVACRWVDEFGVSMPLPNQEYCAELSNRLFRIDRERMAKEDRNSELRLYFVEMELAKLQGVRPSLNRVDRLFAELNKARGFNPFRKHTKVFTQRANHVGRVLSSRRRIAWAEYRRKNPIEHASFRR